MTRQYIGARYVPKFSDVNGGIWNSSYTYEALEIVKHGNDYYTAKKPVPTGIDISNTDYWVLTGNYNGAIADLTERVVDMEKKVNISDRKFWYIGDSFLAGYGVTFPLWGELLDGLLGKTDSYKTGWGGAGFSNPGNNGKTLYENVRDLTNVPDGLTDVVILAGYNDAIGSTYVSTIETDVLALLSEIRTKSGNPNINIIAAYNGLAFNTSQAGFNSRSQYIGYFYTVLKRIFLGNKVAFLDSVGSQLQCRGMLYTDLVHPSQTCQKYISRSFASYILHGLDQSLPQTFIVGPYIFDVAERHIRVSVATLRTLYSGAAFDATAASYDTIATISGNLPFVPRYTEQLSFTGMFRVGYSGGTKCVQGLLVIAQNGDVKIAFAEDLTGVTLINNYGCSVVTIDPFEDIHSLS